MPPLRFNSSKQLPYFISVRINATHLPAWPVHRTQRTLAISAPFGAKNLTTWLRLARTTADDRYRFILNESFRQHFSLLPIPKEDLLIRDEYQRLYNLLCQKSLPRLGGAYSGVAVIGHPGIGQLQLHCVSPDGIFCCDYRLRISGRFK